MSWDVILYKFRDYPISADTKISALKRLSLGKVAEVRDIITRHLPETEWEAHWTGYYLGESFRFEFFVGNMDSGDNDEIYTLGISVYGTVDGSVLDTLLHLAHPIQWTIQEMTVGELILPDSEKVDTH
jgi:hypothetical protein